MRTIRATLFCLMASMVMACSTAESPEVVIQKFEEAMIRLDFETAKTYAANDIVSWIEIVKMGVSAGDIDRLRDDTTKKTVRIIDVAYVEGKKAAIVNLEVMNGDQVEDRKERYLVKKDGRWLVTTHWLISE